MAHQPNEIHLDHGANNDIEHRVALNDTSINVNPDQITINEHVVYTQTELDRIDSFGSPASSQCPSDFSDDGLLDDIQTNQPALPSNNIEAANVISTLNSSSRTEEPQLSCQPTENRNFDSISSTTDASLNTIDVQSLSPSEQENLIFVSIQPPLERRSRYKTEGKRRLQPRNEESITIDLAKLEPFFTSNQIWWLRLALITCSDNPTKIIIHPNMLKYSSEVNRFPDHSIGIRINEEDIKNGKIELKELGITKTLYKDYTFDVIPYVHNPTDIECDTYPINSKKSTVNNAKKFRKFYNTESAQIACQIVIEKNDQHIFTHVTCKTNTFIYN